jgi:uncharacterized LabA/DUF88 family protein
MERLKNNYAFIDSQNLYLAVRELGWRIDFHRFRVYLKEKYGVAKAYLFIGYIEGNTELYKSLQDAGFICIFKPTLVYRDGHTKGNCDAELVLQAMIEYQNYHSAVIVTGDGDFQCLINYLIGNGKLEALLIPNQRKYSGLLKSTKIKPYLRYVNELREKVGDTKKRPQEDGTS